MYPLDTCLGRGGSKAGWLAWIQGLRVLICVHPNLGLNPIASQCQCILRIAASFFHLESLKTALERTFSTFKEVLRATETNLFLNLRAFIFCFSYLLAVVWVSVMLWNVTMLKHFHSIRNLIQPFFFFLTCLKSNLGGYYLNFHWAKRSTNHKTLIRTQKRYQLQRDIKIAKHWTSITYIRVWNRIILI